MGNSQSPSIEQSSLWGLHKAPIERDLVHTDIHKFQSFLLQILGCFTMEALQSPSIEGALLWGLYKAPIERGLCKAPRGFIHTYTHFSLFAYRYGGTSLLRLYEAHL